MQDRVGKIDKYGSTGECDFGYQSNFNINTRSQTDFDVYDSAKYGGGTNNFSYVNKEVLSFSRAEDSKADFKSLDFTTNGCYYLISSLKWPNWYLYIDN